MCLFCDIIANKIPSTKIYEDENILAFNDINPTAPVHILLVPKKHIASIAELEEADTSLIGKLIYAAKKIAAEKDLSGYKLQFNVGQAGGQIIFHVHLHLLGGWEK